MSSQITGDIPEVIEEYLEYKHGVIKCIAFNHRGTLLAAGCSNGSCIVWDFETRVIAKELKDEGCTTAITSVCWSKYGHCILVSTGDKRLILWDVSTGEQVAQTTLEIISLHAQLHPVSSIPSLCLVSPIYSAPLIVDLSMGSSTVLPVSFSEGGNDSDAHFPSCFNHRGDLVYVGNSKGEILIIDHHSFQIRAIVSSSSGGEIKNIAFSRNGMYLLTNSSDRTIRIYKNKLPLKDSLKVLCKMGEMLNDLGGIGTKCLVLSREFQDRSTRTHWKAPSFSRNGKWIIGGSTGEGVHKVYIWNDVGHLVKILTGPREGLISLAWHPVQPIVVSLSSTGLVYIWAKNYTEKWSDFYPDFKELDETEEYVEREDEFDSVPEIVPKITQVKELDVTHVSDNEEADIVTIENDSTWSDSEMSEEELCFLPSVPRPDTFEQHDKCTGDSLKSSGGYHSINHESNLMDGTDDCHDFAGNVAHGGRSKRQRKPTEKLLELLDETAKKLVKKTDWPNAGV
ncbi:hypothetical protein vseg_006986 [Gypsophila vaccaria]